MDHGRRGVVRVAVVKDNAKGRVEARLGVQLLSVGETKGDEEFLLRRLHMTVIEAEEIVLVEEFMTNDVDWNVDFVGGLHAKFLYFFIYFFFLFFFLQDGSVNIKSTPKNINKSFKIF